MKRGVGKNLSRLKPTKLVPMLTIKMGSTLHASCRVSSKANMKLTTHFDVYFMPNLGYPAKQLHRWLTLIYFPVWVCLKIAESNGLSEFISHHQSARAFCCHHLRLNPTCGSMARKNGKGSNTVKNWYPLVNIQKTMKNHKFLWVNPL